MSSAIVSELPRLIFGVWSSLIFLISTSSHVAYVGSQWNVISAPIISGIQVLPLSSQISG